MKFFLLTMLLIAGTMTRGDEWIDSPDGFEYKSNVFSCKITKNGSLRNLKICGENLFRQMLIFGRIKINEKEERIFQTSKATEIKAKSEGVKTLIKASGSLLSEAKEKVAEYKEEIIFAPDKIQFSYEVTTTHEMEMKSWTPFCSLITTPASDIAGRAVDMVELNGKRSILEIQKEYRRKLPWPKKIVQAKIVSDEGVVEISFPNSGKEIISIADGRAWKGKGVEVVLRPLLKSRRWKSNPDTRKSGTVFQWSFIITYDKY